MIKKIFLSDIAKFCNQETAVEGWVYNLRSSGSIIFLQLRDGTGTIQAVLLKNELGAELFESAKNLNLESSIRVQGLVKEDERAPSGYELAVIKIEIFQNADENYPIGKKGHGVSFLLDQRHFWLRSPRQRALLKIRAETETAINGFFTNNNFVKLDTPIFTPSACEGTTTLFGVDYFGEKSYLSQSGQLYLEAGIFTFNRVYDFQPVFRAEKSKTRRHLIEFWMSNAEAAFVKHEENMQIQEKLLMHILGHLLDKCKKEFETIGRDTEILKKVKTPFVRIKYTDAVFLINKLGIKMEIGDDFGADEEAVLSKEFDSPFFVEQYPAKIKAFYMKKTAEDKNYVLNDDLLAPEGYGEICGGSEREGDFNLLKEEMIKRKMPIDDFKWYLDLRKYGSVVHSGFGLGLERVIAWVCGLKHVRTAIAFPRLLNRNYP